MTPNKPTILLPHSHEAERSLLSAFFLAPDEVGGMISERKIEADAFQDPAHAAIFTVLLDRWNESKPIDLVTVTQQLVDKGELMRIGGPALLAEIYGFLPTAANAAQYVDILHEKRKLRSVLAICHEFQRRAHEEQDQVSALLADLEQRVLAAGDEALTKDVAFNKHLMDSISRADEAHRREVKLLGLSTGLPNLDEAIGGLCDTDFIVVAAETGGGKTALAMRFLESVAVDQGKAAALFSFEMTNDQVADRLISGCARVDLHAYRNGRLDLDKDFERINEAGNRLLGAQIHLQDQSELTILQVRSIARRLRRTRGIRLVIIDYAQLVAPTPSRTWRNREQEVAEISRHLKAMAKELKIPVVALSQLNDEGKVRESRALGHDANVVITVQIEQDGDETRHFLNIGKNRNGPRVRIPVRFLAEFARFE
jgi:replicative DNA helicase